MAKATPLSLSNSERGLLAETERDELAKLDEDELIALLGRVRRARDKFVGQHRREVAGQVSAKGARGKASVPPRRSAGKAEIFETALARVSTSLAAAARRSAKELKDERLAQAAGAPKPPTAKKAAPKRKPAPKGSTKSPARSPREKKVAASTRAKGARRQATRDAR